MPQEPQSDGQVGAAVTFITAFEPFGGAPVNGSQEVMRHWMASDRSVHGVTLPVVRGVAAERALTELSALPAAPALFLALGEADSTPVVRLEKVAINWEDFRIPDNAGNQPRDCLIRAEGPDAYFSTVPVGRIAQALAGRTSVPVRVSLSAGAFLCNHLAYTVLHRPSPVPFLFLHVPAWRPADGEEAIQALTSTLRAVRDEILATF